MFSCSRHRRPDRYRETALVRDRARTRRRPGDPTWLFYVTGGLAYGGFNSNETFTFGAATSINNFNTTRAGWTVGGGIEGSLGNNWSAKLEYLYMDFGTFNGAFIGVAPFTPIALSTHVTDNIVRVGVNYHFH